MADQPTFPAGRTHRARRDPLAEPAYLIGAYLAWAAGSSLWGWRVGLGVLVLGAAVLLTAGLRHVPRRGDLPTFTCDLALILYYCCAAIGAGVLATDVLGGG